MHVIFAHSVDFIFISYRLIEIEEVFMLKFDRLATHVSQDFYCQSICVKDSQVLALILLHHVFLIIISRQVNVASKYQYLI